MAWRKHSIRVLTDAKATEVGKIDKIKNLVDSYSTFDINKELFYNLDLDLANVVYDDGNSRFFTAIHYAARQGYCGLISYFINSLGANVNRQDYMGNTPLHIAIYYQHEDVVELLLSYCASPNVKNYASQSVPFMYMDAGSTPLHYAAKYGSKRVIDMLCSKGGNLKLTNAFRKNPREVALMVGRYSNSKFLAHLEISHVDPTQTYY